MNFKNIKNENGRTLFEILCVLVVMAIFTVIGIISYRQAVGKQEANILYEDVLAQAEHLRHKTGMTNKSIYDSAVGTHTRSGLLMTSENKGKIFSVTVHNVNKDDCLGLIEAKWPLDRVARIRINQMEYEPNEIGCDITEDFDLTVVFWANSATKADKEGQTSVLQKLCTNGCLECQKCENNFCVDNCIEGSFCSVTEAEPNGECIIPEEENEDF